MIDETKTQIRIIGKKGNLVYYYLHGVLKSRTYFIPVQPGTPAQQIIWQKFREGVADWQALTETEKEVWNQKAYRKKIEGFNLFMRTHLKS